MKVLSILCTPYKDNNILKGKNDKIDDKIFCLFFSNNESIQDIPNIATHYG